MTWRNWFGRGARLGLELGQSVAGVEIDADTRRVTAFGEAADVGPRGRELGHWLQRWLPSTGATTKRVHAVIADGSIHHYLVQMPEMTDSERHLAVGAEVRKQAQGSTDQLVYSHAAVGEVYKDDATHQQVMIATVDRGSLDAGLSALQTAGLEPEAVVTVPAALVKAAQLLGPIPGGMALAYLSNFRCHLLVFEDGIVQLVREFSLQAAGETSSREQLAEIVAGELRRSMLYFSQRAQGAAVERLVLAGPLVQLRDLTGPLMESLELAVELYDSADEIDLTPLGERTPNYRQAQPALAAALGAASLQARRLNLLTRGQSQESQVRKMWGVGGVAAAALFLLLGGWGVFQLLQSGVRQRNLANLEERIVSTRQQLQEARSTAQARADHRLRRSLLDFRAQEANLIGALLQVLSRSVPDQMVFSAMNWDRSLGLDGEPYWNARTEGLVFGATRSESQATFARFFSRLTNDPMVHQLEMVEPLVIGDEQARPLHPAAGYVRESFARGGARESFSQPPIDVAPEGGTVVRSSLDDLPPFAATDTSVGFNISVQLKTVGTGEVQ